MTVKNEHRPSLGPARLAGALRYSIAGFRHATRHEAAFQQEVLVSLLLLPAALLLRVSALERLILVVSMLFVIVVELLNSAIEATVDRISAERHPLAGQAKDMGSAAVFVALVMSLLCWR
jgi:diacylglycerol kinase (ATP)